MIPFVIFGNISVCFDIACHFDGIGALSTLYKSLNNHAYAAAACLWRCPIDWPQCAFLMDCCWFLLVVQCLMIG
jgi:hypothetical protein